MRRGPRRSRPFKGAFRLWCSVPRAVPYLRPYKKLAAGAVLFTSATAAIGLVAPWPLALMVDSVLGKQAPPAFVHWFGLSSPYALLIFAALAGLGVTIVSNALTVGHDWVGTKLEQRIILDFRSDLFRHVQRLSFAFHDEKFTGQLMSQVNYESDSAGQVLMAILPLAQSAFTLVGMFWIAFRLDPLLALLSLTVVPFLYYSVGLYGTRIIPRLQYVRGLEWQTLSIIYEAMSMLRVIVAFGRERYEHGRFRKQGETAVDARVHLTIRQTLFSLGVNTCTAAGTALVLAVGAYHVLHHRLTVGELLVVMSYIAAVYAPLEAISSTMGSLQQQLVQLEGAFMILDTVPEIRDAPDAVAIRRAAGRVGFEHVDFAYNGRAETLKDISFDVPPGARIAIVGPTGAGKTTLVSLLQRFYEPASGRILLDGRDIRTITLTSLRDQISVVLQEPLLFSGSIADNIRYGCLEAGMEELVEAAKAANAHEFISNLPAQYETQLGEGGAKLSVGERQRICVARAFLKDAPVLILDEPTSSIDSKTESVILEALDRLAVGRTTFIIAHRLSTVHGADLVLVVNQGRVLEQGTHEELLARHGLYRQLWEAQTVARRRPFAIEPDRPEPAAPEPVPAPALPPLVPQDGAAAASGNGRAGSELLVGLARARLDAAESNGALAGAAWSLVGAARTLLESGSLEPLRQLARRQHDPQPGARVVGELAGSLIDDLGLQQEDDEVEPS